MCCSLVSNTNGPRNSAWYQDASRRAGILVCSPDLSIRDFLETDAGFASVEVAGVRAYSCYFSPSDPFEISLRPRSSSLRKTSERLVADPLLRAT